jgi:hypothetical protein
MLGVGLIVHEFDSSHDAVVLDFALTTNITADKTATSRPLTMMTVVRFLVAGPGV